MKACTRPYPNYCERMSSFRSMFRLAAVLAPAVMILACSDSTSPNRGDPYTGTFVLTNADDQPLPATVFDGIIVVPEPDPSFHLRILATTGSITIDANGHYRQLVDHDAFVDGVFASRVTRSDHGDCTRAGNQLTCLSNYLEGIEFTGTFSGSTLTIAQDLSGEGQIVSYRYGRATLVQ
jgi:hypothetical protein